MLIIAETKKLQFRQKYLEPKINLKAVRKSKKWSTSYVASLIGLERRQYELKESGKYPFRDYEMKILSEAFKMSIVDLFF